MPMLNPARVMGRNLTSLMVLFGLIFITETPTSEFIASRRERNCNGIIRNHPNRVLHIGNTGAPHRQQKTARPIAGWIRGVALHVWRCRMICPECDGTGIANYRCESCGGSGEDRSGYGSCSVCRGGGIVEDECQNCNGDGLVQKEEDADEE